MKATVLHLNGALLIEPAVYGDHRGIFEKLQRKEIQLHRGAAIQFIQHDRSISKESGAVRKLHYQLEPTYNAPIG